MGKSSSWTAPRQVSVLGMQSSRHSLLQHRFPRGSQVLPGNLQRGLFSPQVCWPLPGPCSSTGLPWVHSLLSGIHLLQHGLLHRLQVDLCILVILHGLQGHSCLTMVFTMGYRRISAPVPGAPPSRLPWSGCLQGCSYHMFSPHSSLPNNFFPS